MTTTVRMIKLGVVFQKKAGVFGRDSVAGHDAGCDFEALEPGIEPLGHGLGRLAGPFGLFPGLLPDELGLLLGLCKGVQTLGFAVSGWAPGAELGAVGPGRAEGRRLHRGFRRSLRRGAGQEFSRSLTGYAQIHAFTP